MELLADTHVHIYPEHDAAALVCQAAARLRSAATSSSAVCALFLTEGRGFHFWRSLLDGSHGLPASFRVEKEDESLGVRLSWSDADSLWIFAGRQLIAAERVEILAFTLSDELEDGRPAADIVKDVEARGAVPALAWAPGKWMFGRADVVRDLTQQFGPDRLLLGDTSLRPVGWPEPALMREPGRKVLAGSDPLPFAGEEKRAGTYGVRMQGAFDERQPVPSIRRLLLDPQTVMEHVGSRNSIFQMAARLYSHHRNKNKS